MYGPYTTNITISTYKHNYNLQTVCQELQHILLHGVAKYRSKASVIISWHQTTSGVVSLKGCRFDTSTSVSWPVFLSFSFCDSVNFQSVSRYALEGCTVTSLQWLPSCSVPNRTCLLHFCLCPFVSCVLILGFSSLKAMFTDSVPAGFFTDSLVVLYGQVLHYLICELDSFMVFCSSLTNSNTNLIPCVQSHWQRM